MENYGYYPVACATIPVSIGDVDSNVKEIIKTIKETDPTTRVLVFPELCISGYTAGDLFYQQLLLENCEDALSEIAKRNTSDMILVVGLPLRQSDRLFNCAAFIYHHEILGIVPKTYLPNYNEFYEKRWFCGSEERNGDTINLSGKEIPFTPNLIIEDETTGARIACDICEDLWVPIPPSTYHTLQGANVIVNLSASNETIGKADYRRNIIATHSAKCICGYVYASAGADESTSDLVFSGHNIIMDNGTLIAQSSFQDQQRITYGEIDLMKLQADRIKFQTIRQHPVEKQYHTIQIQTPARKENLQLVRTIAAHPFVPKNHKERYERCHSIMDMQATGLAQRLKKIHCQRLVIGISGGLDSTLALIVAKKAFDKNGYDARGIYAVTMPGFGTTSRTHDNSTALMKALDTTMMEISIKDACLQHYQDIDHDPTLLDITYENTQARERTQILMDLANKYQAIVLGTGDLSELALGWCTYNGDHMSMYAVNASIPKTLVRYLVETYSEEQRSLGRDDIADILDDICATPVSPELLPPKDNGEINQITEDTIGSYDYHDFFLYHMLRNQEPPKKIYALALIAFGEDHATELKETMKMFYRRFFTQQFKRNCMPDGVKVGSICLSPRGDWRMPSDANFAMWMREVEEL